MISIIVPIYNVESYLYQCMDSIIKQTYQDIEIILVDDGSLDGGGKICDAYAGRDCRIKVIHKENGGLVSARKAGLSVAEGEWIGYVDGDDWIEPDMYEKLMIKALEYDADIAMCGRYEDTGDISKPVYHGFPEGYYDRNKLLTEIYPKMMVGRDFFEWGIFPGVWDKLFKREIIEDFQMQVDERIMMGEDAACVYPCMLSAKRVYILHECLYHYRQSTDSMIKRKEDTAVERERFEILYTSVLQQLDRLKGVYSLTNQWKKYMLFLMLPRADSLYDGVENLDYLFPFPGVSKGEKILLYGAGTYGQRLYQWLKESSFCSVIMWADRNYKEIQKHGLDVRSPEEIRNADFDHIVIAIINAGVRKAVKRELAEIYGENKVEGIDEKLIMSEDTERKFRMR